MKMTKERKVLAAVLGVAVLALLVNAFIPGNGLTGPSNAQAARQDTAASDRTPAAAPVTASFHPINAAPVGPGLAQRLEEFAKRHPLSDTTRDAFAPSQAWLEQAGMIQPTNNRRAQGLREFRAKHHLMALVVEAGHAVAVVDDQPMKVGDKIDGYALLAVQHRSAIFSGPHGRVSLNLDPQNDFSGAGAGFH